MITIQLQVKGVDSTEASLERIKNALTSFEPELKSIGQDLVQFFTTPVFETEGSVYGQAWTPLALSTVKQKAKKFPGRGILEATGKMRNGYRLFTTAQYALINNTAPYARFHQTGTRKMPQRVLVKIDQQREKMIQDKFSAGITERLAEALI